MLFPSSGPLAKAVMAAGWSPAEVTSVRIALAAVLLVPAVAVLRPRALRFRRTDLLLLSSYGLLGVAGVQAAARAKFETAWGGGTCCAHR